MKFLYMTDLHIRSQMKQRKDDLLDTMSSKLSSVSFMAQELGVDLIVCGGDVFDAPNPALSAAGIFVKFLKECPIPVFSIPGQHDMYGYNRSTLWRTQYGLIAAGDLFTDVYSLTPFEDFTFMDHRYAQDNPKALLDCDVEIVHELLLPFPFLGQELPIESFNTKAKVVVSADYHPGYPIHWRSDGVVFVHPGALMRTENSKTERARTVQVALVDLNKEETPEVTYLPLPGVLPAEEVFLDRAEGSSIITEIADFCLDPFLAKMDQTDFSGRALLTSLVHSAVNNAGLSDSVATAVLDRFTQKGLI